MLRTSLRAVLVLVFLGSLLWIYIGWPLEFRLTVALMLVAAAAAALFAAYYRPLNLSQELRRGLRVGVAVLLAVATVLGISSLQAPSPSSKPSPTPSPAEVIFDDFNTTLEDDKNWTLSAVHGHDAKQLPDQIYTKDGKLHLEVTPKNSVDGVGAELRAKFPSDWTITKISVKMTLERQKGRSDGAAYLSLSSFENRENRAWMGPGGENQNLPMLGFCQLFDDQCDIASQYQIRKGEKYQIDAVTTKQDSNSQRYLNFHVGGHEPWGAYFEPGSGEIRSFRFYVSSDPKRDFHVTVDDVLVSYVRK